MATETNETRLDRIESKIDKLADAMISLARAEEKIIALQEERELLKVLIIISYITQRI